MFDSYWAQVWKRFKRHRLGYCALYVVLIFCLLGIYAPFLASGKPLVVMYNGELFFPLFRYLFYSGFYTKHLDIFFNLLIFSLPLALFAFKLFPTHRWIIFFLASFFQIAIFLFLVYFSLKDPASDRELNQERHQQVIAQGKKWIPSWDFELQYQVPYAKLNAILRYQNRLEQNQSLEKYVAVYTQGIQKKQDNRREEKLTLPTLWELDKQNEQRDIARLMSALKAAPKDSEAYARAQGQLQFIQERQKWLEEETKKIRFNIMPLLSHFHWEEDAGGQQTLNQYLPWWELTRINRKDLLSALLFGIRISLSVGLISVAIALLIGIPIGAYAGYYGGRMDIIVSRLLEIWEAMPVFFMLLMTVSILQSKSIFLVTLIIGFFGWTQFSRYIRGEFFKQRNLPYVEACHALGFNNRYIVFKHILPNSIPPILTLLPFAIMAAITSEAGLSFLGLGEEGSCSWGVLMDEGRNAFPAESYLLWPPAILLTILLVAIALVGDSLRDTLDPKLHR